MKQLFFCSNLAFFVKQQNQFLNKTEKPKENKFGTLMFLFVQRMVLFEKSTDDVWKKQYFLQVFEVFAFDLVTRSSFFWPFVFWFFLFWIIIYFFLLLFHKSSFYVLVVVSVFFGCLGFIICYILDLFYFLFVFVFCVLRVRWGGSKGHLTWS